MIPPKRFDIFPPLTEGCSEGLDAFRFFFKYLRTDVRPTETSVAPVNDASRVFFSSNEQQEGVGGVRCQTFYFVLFSLFSRPRAGLANV